MNCQPIFDVVTLHRVIVLHDFTSKDKTQLLWFSLKLLRNKSLKLRTKEKKSKR